MSIYLSFAHSTAILQYSKLQRIRDFEQNDKLFAFKAVSIMNSFVKRHA